MIGVGFRENGRREVANGGNRQFLSSAVERKR